ncbi:MAG: DNA topoisomerase IB [Candidatus Eremiobacteraeota bacterium]|nr:DNA topoisomerase IB [Candidatus Eremiobacteraeota bacterium]
MVSALDAPAIAKEAGLRYVTDTIPGISRHKRGRSFAYTDADGKAIRDKGELARIGSIGIPPAYTDVWICPYRNGHIQATGRDARGRKQYRYHPHWREVRDENKFDRMVAFAKALPAMRKAVARDLGLRGMPREKVLAAVIALLERTAIRVGNEEYARANESYGLTTLQEEHAEVRGSTIQFHFRGKSKKFHEIEVRDKRLAKIVRASQELPGEHLFEYLDDDGEARPIHSDDVNSYLRDISGEDFTAKDFRTWEGTMHAAVELATLRADGVTEAKRIVKEVVKKVADLLGNTPAVCRKSYIYPGVIDEFVRNGALELVGKSITKADEHALDAHEIAVVELIERIIAREHEPLSKALERSVKAERAKRKRKRASAA